MLGFKEYVNEVELLSGIPKHDKLGYEDELNVPISKIFKGAKRLPGEIAGYYVYKAFGTSDFSNKPSTSFILTNRDGLIKIIMNAVKMGVSYKVESLIASDDNDIKAYSLYAWLIKNQGITLVSDDRQSEGGKRVWEKLSQEPGIGVHGWLRGKAVNLGRRLGVGTEDETHVGDDEYYRQGLPQDVKNVSKMILVAFKK